jgi:hypothetical protein
MWLVWLQSAPFVKRPTLHLSLCLALTVVSAANPAVSLEFTVDATESTNAIYHLACLADQIPCTKDAFERFWHDTLHWTAADQRELGGWIGGLRKIALAAGRPQASPYLGNYRSFLPDVDAQLQIMHAAIESRSLAEFRRRTRRWLSYDEAASLQHAMAHFRNRLRPWWRTTGHNAVQARLQQTQRQLRSHTIVTLAGQVAAFVEAESPARDIYVHFIPGPEPKSDAASATFVSNHCFVEVTGAATPDGMTSVSMHELTHYLYETAQARRHLELMQQFVSSEVPDASALYALLNEALASAVQGLLSERSRSSEAASDEGDYRHPFIPRLGHSTVPVLKDALARGSTLYQGFAQAYLRAATHELGGDTTNPKFFLTSAAILPTEKGASAYEVFLKEFEPVSFIRSDQWRLFPNLNLAFLHAYDELAAFSTAFPALVSYTNRRGFAYMDSRDGHARICILAGADAEAIADVVRAFAKLKSVAASGLVLSVD